MKVYVVTEGCYSDYHIVGVTTDKETAKAYVKKEKEENRYSDCEVEEYDTDVLDRIPKDCLLYRARKGEGENEFHVYEMEPTDVDEVKKPKIVESVYFGARGKVFEVILYARNEEHATKVASEIYAEFIWNNPDAWGK